MFRVDYRFNGQGMWYMPSLPVSLQAAVGQARARSDSLTADEVRVAPSSPTDNGVKPRLVDLLI